MNKAEQAITNQGGVWTDDGWVVHGNLYLNGSKMRRLPKIHKVGGSFWCDVNQLTTLQGSPQVVGGSFYCDYNKLITLEGGSKIVGGNFSLYNNQLTSLQGAPQTVGGDFYCGFNNLH